MIMSKSSAEAFSGLNKTIWEHARLQREVEHKARAWRADMTHKSDATLVAAVDALIEFEKTHADMLLGIQK